MDYYRGQYSKMKNIFTEGSKFTWNINSNKQLVLYTDSKPVSVVLYES